MVAALPVVAEVEEVLEMAVAEEPEQAEGEVAEVVVFSFVVFSQHRQTQPIERARECDLLCTRREAP